ncbi:cytochrome c-type biogenesis protein CcmH [Marinihelvus fidelis]|uniref:Cytochrome c-type biogenesis protein n=1 Tax=Marinihelvus fidelis TaxID=2613842 RepID=A0A5N0T6Z2_9GAMM|nr:cytochrome c-type biogenesis protein [Marinihelvus fidelis]KAA9130561.1 cytochrome c-type biogenesis protein CcmH [Marinihelvus fidelis]
MTRSLVFALLTWLVAATALAQPSANREPLVFESAAEQARFQALAAELRCVVCQNQSLADSNAVLAQDLRHEVWRMMREGHDDEAIKRFMVERYGDFVLYRPPVQPNTVVLWVAPLFLLLAGAVLVGVNIRRRRGLLDDEESELP